MAGGGSPRQKMINMMYLVLTALLALNVSKEILNAFVIMNDGLQDSRFTLEKKNQTILDVFKQTAADNAKYKPNYDKAVAINKEANDLIKYIEDIKIELTKEADGPETEAVSKLKNGSVNLALLGKKDDYDTPTRVLAGDGGAKGKADDMKAKLDAFAAKLVGMVDAKSKKAMEAALTIDTKPPTGDEQKESPEIKTWGARLFYHTPMAAAIAHLAKIQGDVRKVEGEMISYLFQNVDAASVKFDNVIAIAAPKYGFVFRGGQQEVRIVLGAYDSKQTPNIVVNGSPLAASNIVDGVGTYKTTGGSVGEQTVKGTITIQGPEGPITKEFETSFVVGDPLATVSATAMNVFYIGVENPVEVSVSGAASNAISPSMAGGGSISGSNGKYIVKVDGVAPGSKVKVNVSAKLPDGTSKSFDGKEYRVKRVPDPKIYFGTLPGGPAPLSSVKVQPGLVSKMENFDFNLTIPVVSYEVSVTSKGVVSPPTVVNGASISPAAGLISKLSPGSKVFIENIKVRAPDGIRRMPDMIITCK